MQVVDGKLQYNTTIKRILNNVQLRGNDDVRYVRDSRLYKMEEKWNYPQIFEGKLSGDCEDISLHKRKLLIEAGIPIECLALTICTTPHGEGHAVLCVITTHGDYILCNMHSGVMSARSMIDDGFKFLYRQVPGKGIDEPWDILK